MEDDLSTSDLDLSKYFEKTCLMCFKTGKNARELFDLWLADGEQITLLEKLQSFSRESLWVTECTALCDSCLKDLSNALQFRTQLSTSQAFWKNAPVSCKIANFCSENKNPSHSLPASQDVTSFISQIENFDHKISAEEVTQLANDPLTYYSCKHCNALLTSTDEFSPHKCFNALDSSDGSIVETVNITSKKISKPLNFACDLCGKKFKHINGRSSHRAKVHFQQKTHPCNFCSKSFKQKYHLIEHLASHTGEKRHRCSICNKVFQRLSSLHRHMKTHQRPPGEKMKQTPFLCTICGKTFPYSNGVQRHLRIHSGERKYECKICGRKFAQSTHLQVHLRTHTGERPYMCNFCGESFVLNAALQKHITNSHTANHNS